jgi:hypothetical protein
MRNSYRILAEKFERKRPLERPRHKWEDNIGTCFIELGREDITWIRLVQYGDELRAPANTVIISWVP